MKGFIASTVITVLVIGFVLTSTLVMNHRIGEVRDMVESGDFDRAEEKFEDIRPFLHLFTPDDLLQDVEVAFSDVEFGGEEEKSRLSLLLKELRRQAGFHPISVL